jgi:arsenite-transporting ATPase
MNRVLPDEAAVGFFRDWAVQARLLTQEVEESFAPLPVLTAPLQPDEVLGVAALAEHGATVFGERDPAGLLSTHAGLVLRREGDTLEVALSLPGARPDALDVAMLDGQLVIRTPTRRRQLPLPRYAASLGLRTARLEGGTLHVALAPGGA